MNDIITLTPQMMVVLAILAFTIFLFVSEIVRIDVAAIAIMVSLGLLGMVPGGYRVMDFMKAGLGMT